MEKRIYYHDTDAGGVVYYGRYLQFLEEARTEFLEQRGLNVPQLHQLGFLYAVRDCQIKYKKPARYGDIIICDAVLAKMTAAKMIFEQHVYHKESGELLTEALVTLVSLNKDFKPVAIPEEVKAKISAS